MEYPLICLSSPPNILFPVQHHLDLSRRHTRH
jgi:hypothetical protein